MGLFGSGSHPGETGDTSRSFSSGSSYNGGGSRASDNPREAFKDRDFSNSWQRKELAEKKKAAERERKRRKRAADKERERKKRAAQNKKKEQQDKTRENIGIGKDVLSGASKGAAFGPIGMVAGGVLGGALSEDVDTGIDVIEDVKDFNPLSQVGTEYPALSKTSDVLSYTATGFAFGGPLGAFLGTVLGVFVNTDGEGPNAPGQTNRVGGRDCTEDEIRTGRCPGVEAIPGYTRGKFA